MNNKKCSHLASYAQWWGSGGVSERSEHIASVVRPLLPTAGLYLLCSPAGCAALHARGSLSTHVCFPAGAAGFAVVAVCSVRVVAAIAALQLCWNSSKAVGAVVPT